MLVPTRRNQESVVMGGGGNLHRVLKVTVLEINGNKFKLGIESDGDISVFRGEIWEHMLAIGDIEPCGPCIDKPNA